MFREKLGTARRRLLVIVAALMAVLLAWPAGALAAENDTEDGYEYFITDSGTVIKRPVSGTKPKDHTRIPAPALPSPTAPPRTA